MNDQRLSMAIGLGIGAALTALVATLTGHRRFAFLAGLAGAGAAYVTAQAGRESAHQDDRLSSMTEQIRQLENAVATQVQGRMTAEDAVRSLNTQLADAERRAGRTSGSPVVVDPESSPATSGGLTDLHTGLFNHDYFLVALDSRIAAARRHLRPVSVALIDVVKGRRGADRPPADPKLVADCLRETLRESDTATRLRDGRYGVVLEDTPENGAIWTMERVRRCLAEDDSELTMWAGIACYPAHAFDVPALIDRADQALTDAHEWHQDRIEVATSD